MSNQRFLKDKKTSEFSDNVRWDYRLGRNPKPQRNRRTNHEENAVHFDESKGTRENILEALKNVCQLNGITNAKKLGYLNAFVKLISEKDSSEYGISTEEILCCLRACLVHEAIQVRAAGLRALRFMLKKDEDVIIINNQHFPYLLARIMDLCKCNDMEHVQVLRVLRRILIMSPRNFSPALARTLVSIVSVDSQEKRASFLQYLAILCELAVLNSRVFIITGGIGALARLATLEEEPAVVEAVVAVLLRLLLEPETRSRVSLHCLASPYCELEAIAGGKTKEDWEKKFSASKCALLSVLRSYSGVMHFCHPNDSSGLKAIVDILYIEKMEVRNCILEVLYELFEIPLPMWTDEADVALAAVDPCRFRDTWKLYSGFVAAEGKTVLPNLAYVGPNITELHLALLIFIFLECGLHKALAEIIITSETFISLRSTVLLGMLLHLAQILLPQEVYDLTLPLPNLLQNASAGKHQALAAVGILEKIEVMMRRRPRPSSLFLSRLLEGETWLMTNKPKLRKQSHSIKQWLKKVEPMAQMLKDSQVLTSKDALAWNWSVIRSILRSRDDALLVSQDSEHKMFVKKLVKYFKPSSNQYSRIELATNAVVARETTLACCDLINCLLDSQPEGTRLLFELVKDIAHQLSSLRVAKSAHDCLFSPRHVTTTSCQYYFLLIGHLSDCAMGSLILEVFNMIWKLQDLAIKTNHDCYVKLIISSLNYSKEGQNRKLLKALISDSPLESTRLYATQYLRIILRAKLMDSAQWSISLLLNRIADSSKLVAYAALDILQEASQDVKYLEIMYQEIEVKIGSEKWQNWLEHLGDQGYLFKIRFYSMRSAFGNLPSASEEMDKWLKSDGFAEHYVGIIEEKIHNSLVQRHRLLTGAMSKFKYDSSFLLTDIFIPPHLFGQLAQHEFGLQLIFRKKVLQKYTEIIQKFQSEIGMVEFNSEHLETIVDSEIFQNVCSSPKDDEANEENNKCYENKIKIVKSAIWALGHIGTSDTGIEHLNHLGLIELLIKIAEICPYYSIKASSMYALSLISTKRAGADALAVYNWYSVRYKRGEKWPIAISSNSLAKSPSPIKKHQRSMSDSKPHNLTDPCPRRSRICSESAADLDNRSPCSSSSSTSKKHRQRDSDIGFTSTLLRSLRRHKKSSRYSHGSLELAIDDSKESLQSQELASIDDSHFMGITLPKNIIMIFCDNAKPAKSTSVKPSCSIFEFEVDEHDRVCLICSKNKSYAGNNRVHNSEQFIKIRREILRLTQCLANPVCCSRMSLLRLRQQYPDIFKDTCIYSDVAAHLASITYKIKTRVFIQELFLDSCFTALNQEANEIIEKNANNKRLELNGEIHIPVKENYENSDEKIILDILRPEEKLRLSKNVQKKI